MGPTNNLIYLLHHLASVINKQVDQTLREQLGLGLSQYKILMALEWNPRTGQKAIASALGQTEASVSRQISLLQKKGLLAAKADPANRRKHITVATPMGMQLAESATAILRRSFGPEFSRLGEDGLLHLVNNLQQLHKIVCRPGRLGACDHQLGL